MLIIIEKCKKVRKRDRKLAAHYRGMACSLPNIAFVLVLKSR